MTKKEKVMKEALRMAAEKIAIMTESLGECPSDSVFKECCDKNKESGCTIKQATGCYISHFKSLAQRKVG